ncbi:MULTISPECIES: DUF952 domain-containing protein [unclassified Actinotalea]|uniref:DUF952 domain-containing protein n=1 Tax=unclassified Actinotalea TaxID=2638618 RepID=UPI001C70DBD7|nr:MULTISPECIES: DUF952 domain-containing protein [unclassified Actinotalea]
MAIAPTVLHLAERTYWDAARERGVYERSTRGASFEQVGYVHAATPAQLPAVGAAVHGDDAAADLVLLVVDLDRLARHGVEVRWENLEGGEERYPHLYAPLPVEAVVRTLAVPEADGGGADWAALVAAVRG